MFLEEMKKQLLSQVEFKWTFVVVILRHFLVAFRVYSRNVSTLFSENYILMS